MIVSVTALGSRTGDAAGAATKVVRYLEGRTPADGGRHPGPVPEVPGVDGTSAVTGYYADSMAAPGIWMGQGLTGVHMDGLVDPEHLHRVLVGQHPQSGEQLVGANGSAQRAQPRTTAAALAGPDDELLTLTEAADALGVSASYLRERARATYKARSTRARQEGHGQEPTPLPPSHLDATQAVTGAPWQVRRAELRRFAEERDKPSVVVGYDLTFSAPKSVSVLWAAATPAQQVAIEAALTDAVRVGVRYLEEHAAYVRVSVANETGKGRHLESQRARGLLAGAYLHETSRALDPQLHFHVVVANMAEGPDGKVRTLDGRALYFHARTASHLAAAELRHRLASDLGLAWKPVHRGLADVDGVFREAIVEMSQRKAQMDRHIEGMDGRQPTTARGRQIAAYDTRAAKDAPVDPDALRPAWEERLAGVGFDRKAIEACYDLQRGPALVTDDDRRELFNLMSSQDGITEFAATFDRRDVLRFVADWAGDRLGVNDIEDLADRWLLNPEIVRLEPAQRDSRTGDARTGDARTGDVIRRADGRTVRANFDEQLYTTRAMLGIEAGIDAAYLRGRGAGVAVVPPATVDAILADRRHLGDDQVEMVRALTSAGHRIQAVYGPAGSGKTTALEAAARAWEEAGYNVVGGAVQGTAAEIVGDKAGVRNATVASVLWRVASGDRSINASSVIIVDEASTLGNRDFLALTRAAERTGASLILIGDPAQHTAVAAGGAWRALLEAYPDDVARLRHVRRQKGEDMADVRQALVHWRAGKIDKAINLLDSHGRVVVASDRDELLTTVVDDWYADRLRRKDNPDLSPSSMMTERHRERRELNALARARLVADGTLHGPVLRAGELEFQAGDEVMALEQERDLRPAKSTKRGDFVHTAEKGTVVEVRLPAGRRDPGSLVVDFERRGPVVVPMEYLTRPLDRGIVGALAHSYTRTTHAAEGDTYDAARPVATDASSAKGVYVGVTRGEHDLRLYTMFQRDLDPSSTDHPQMPRLDRETNALTAVITQIKDDRDELLASEIDPLAAQAAALRRSHTLTELDRMVASRSLAAPLAARARSEAEAVIASGARLRPDPELTRRLGPRPETPVHRRLWDDAVGQVGLYRARYLPTPVPGGPGVTWALGPIPDDPAQRAAFSATGGLVVDAEEAAINRHSPAELAAERLRLRQVLAVYPGDAERRQAVATQDQARMARDNASEVRAEAARNLHNAEHPALRRPRAWRVEAARDVLAEAEAGVAHAVERFRLARDHVAALEPDAVAEARVPISERLNLVNDAIAHHVDEAVANPAPYLFTALGPRSDNPGQRARWDEAARGLETWRHAELGLGPDDGALGDKGLAAAIGPVPDDSAHALRREMAIDKLPVEFLPVRHTINLDARHVELGIELD